MKSPFTLFVKTLLYLADRTLDHGQAHCFQESNSKICMGLSEEPSDCVSLLNYVIFIY